MHAITHRLDHLPAGATLFQRRVGRLVRLLRAGFATSWDRLMARNAARAAADSDDILWDDGEPEPPADRL